MSDDKPKIKASDYYDSPQFCLLLLLYQLALAMEQEVLCQMTNHNMFINNGIICLGVFLISIELLMSLYSPVHIYTVFLRLIPDVCGHIALLP